MQRVVLSGCSGGGKSTLLAALANRGFPTVSEPGRRIVESELAHCGDALPWSNAPQFARQCIDLALADLNTIPPGDGWAFFNRGLVDAATAFRHFTGKHAEIAVGQLRCYHRQAFLVPPWPEIYKTDGNRRHSFAEAAAEYDRLTSAYCGLGYDVVILPFIGVEERVEEVLHMLGCNQ